MNHNWLGVISAILALCGFFVAYRVTVRQTKTTQIRWALIAAVLSLPGATFAIYYAHVVPEQSWYYEFRSFRGTELLILFIGIAGGAIAAIFPRLFLIVPLYGVAAFSMAPFMKTFLAPIPEVTMEDVWRDGVCRQSTGSTCGAASLATILKYLGVNVTESQLATEAHSYMGGTEAWYLARSARARGFKVRFAIRSSFEPDASFPAIVGVRMGCGHFIAILNREGEQFVIGDPMIGREVLTRKDLLRRYDFTGFQMSIQHRGEQSGGERR